MGSSMIFWSKNVLFCFVFLLFRATPVAYGGSQANWRYSHWPTPKPQQGQIQAASVTYTTAHSNAGSLTHWLRPGIEPATSWVSAVPWWELLFFFFFVWFKGNCDTENSFFSLACWILHTLSEAKVRTCVLMDTNWVHLLLSHDWECLKIL